MATLADHWLHYLHMTHFDTMSLINITMSLMYVKHFDTMFLMNITMFLMYKKTLFHSVFYVYETLVMMSYI